MSHRYSKLKRNTFYSILAQCIPVLVYVCIFIIDSPHLKGFRAFELIIYSAWTISFPLVCYQIISLKYTPETMVRSKVRFWTNIQFFNGLAQFFYAVIFTRELRPSTLIFLLLLLLFLIITTTEKQAFFIGLISLSLYLFGSYISTLFIEQTSFFSQDLFYTFCYLPVVFFIAFLTRHFRKDRDQFIATKEAQFKNKTLHEKLEVEAEQLSKQKGFSQKILQAAEDERKWMAQEIHDDLGQELAALKMNLFLFDPQNKDQQESYDKSKAAIDRTVAKVRALARKLRPIEIDEFGLSKSLENMIRRYDNHFEISIKLADELETLSKTVQIEVYRILQECMTNTVKYAKATKVWLKVNTTRNESSLRIEFGDNGIGLPDDEQMGVGFNGIQERVLLLDGAYAQESKNNKGLVHLIELELKVES
ncbi:histidine kinase [Fibrobacterales bacterium]|nr:histidine kinase [Fibrobacterales bacterium]